MFRSGSLAALQMDISSMSGFERGADPHAVKTPSKSESANGQMKLSGGPSKENKTSLEAPVMLDPILPDAS